MRFMLNYWIYCAFVKSNFGTAFSGSSYLGAPFRFTFDGRFGEKSGLKTPDCCMWFRSSTLSSSKKSFFWTTVIVRLTLHEVVNEFRRVL